MCFNILQIYYGEGHKSRTRHYSIVQIEKKTLSLELVNLDNAYGRILGNGLNSKVDDPRFDNSAMDGWAVRKEDCSDRNETIFTNRRN